MLIHGLQALALGIGTLTPRETWPWRDGEHHLGLRGMGELCIALACPEAVVCRLVSELHTGP